MDPPLEDAERAADRRRERPRMRIHYMRFPRCGGGRKSEIIRSGSTAQIALAPFCAPLIYYFYVLAKGLIFTGGQGGRASSRPYPFNR